MAVNSTSYPILALIGVLMAGYTLASSDIAEKVINPNHYLKSASLIVLGNAPLDSATIVFLPEIHDDPKSLTTQLLLIAQEKAKGKPFILLDESLGAMKKSVWDIFSQKTIEIIAAREQRAEGAAYAPERFEKALQRLANKFRADQGAFSLQKNQDLWTLKPYTSLTTPFFGWDYEKRGLSLLKRNEKLVESLQEAIKNNNRILIMAGARHIPELEFWTSNKLLCENRSFKDMDQYFTSIEARFGKQPSLTHGIGASLPIYNFLSTQRYAVVFEKPLYQELEKVVGQFKSKSTSSCLVLKK